MPVGLVILVLVSVLVLLGVAHRVLDRLRLTDGGALAVIAAMLVGTFIPDIGITRNVAINVGGAIIPVALAVYLFIKAGTAKERTRAVVASIAAGAVVYGLSKFLPAGPEENQFMDYYYLYALIGGGIAYLLGRSRRSAFIAGIMAIVLSDLLQAVVNVYTGIPGRTVFGGAGAFDATVISGVFAVVLAEVVGETREKIQGGTDKKDMAFDKGEFVKNDGNMQRNGGDTDEK
ncbi:MAG: DUF1614 domain-containing protein [Bacillota bacterium]|nr:DUF1614 domain-containing protein [Bacillota bacterium]MDD3297566.1 DUF1614 domain-containing protein [Bacillota bacterium]MDD3850185.1 DUF1614 domain-containing protein [Bacillota bacterium]MDD4707271.1 DUF1614 domain-containing protein [Bacillota bacterium]